MKTETINFRVFMQKKNQVKPLKAHSPAAIGGLILGSTITLPNLGQLANMGFVMVLGVGALAIIMAKAENNLAEKGKHRQADRLASFGAVLFPVIVIGAGIWFLLINNPIVRFWL